MYVSDTSQYAKYNKARKSGLVKESGSLPQLAALVVVAAPPGTAADIAPAIHLPAHHVLLATVPDLVRWLVVHWVTSRIT
jgi:hypothetical protein